jgi:hypothetical protein
VWLGLKPYRRHGPAPTHLHEKRAPPDGRYVRESSVFRFAGFPSLTLGCAGPYRRSRAAMPHTTATQNDHKATLRQINYLKALAAKTGTSFTYPHSSSEASTEIKRLKSITTTGSTFAELSTARNAETPAWDIPVHTEQTCDIHDFEIAGYGSSAHWA